MAALHERIKEAVDAIRLVDTHEHTMLETDHSTYAVDFGYLFAHYNSSDLISAGMPAGLMEAARLPIHKYRIAYYKRRRMRRAIAQPVREDMSLEERWKAVEPYWEMMRNTAYAKMTLIAVRDLFGVEDLNSSTYQKLSEAIADSRRPGWYRYVMKEKAGIDRAVVDIQSTGVDREIFAPVMSLDYFVDVRSRDDLAFLEAETGIHIHSLDDLVSSMQHALANYVADGIVGVKCALAYSRILHFDKVTRHDAEVVFNRISRHLGEGPSFSEAKPLQDYMMHKAIRATIEAGLPMQIHTGLQEGNENIVTNANPTHLINLFVEYREGRFDLFHGGYPFVHEWVTLAKNFPNVYADLCWVHIISPELGRRLLHELIETVPGNKIMAFGGDGVIPEIAYGHSVMARQVVTRVLSEKVEEGYFSEEEAIPFARRILRENPAALFKLKL